jgi:ubiquinone/menaquinone biosynthesis C-methylase UbiE
MTGHPDVQREDQIRAFYGSYVAEQWTRFDSYARVEEYVLNKALRQHLPAVPANILDVGGGNGRHSFHLAKEGYSISLCDITEELLSDARRRNETSEFPLTEIAQCDARELAWPDEYAHAALLLGPMYCLQDRADRAAVLREVRRVLSPGAPLFIQFLSRIAALRSVLEVAAVPADIFDWSSFVRSGVFTESRLPDFFRIHYFTTPAGALSEIEEAGFHATTLRGMDGPASIFGQRALVDAPEGIIGQWGEVAWTIGADPEYRSTSTHLLAVTYK